MENDFLDSPKLSGMTIFKAFMLVFFCVSLIHCIGLFFQAGFLFGFLDSSVHSTAKINLKPNTYGYFIAYTMFILIGLRVNNFDLPIFEKSNLTGYFKILVLSILWIVFCIFLNDLVTTKNIGTVVVNQDFKGYFDFKESLRNINSLLYIVFYIGILGHGLLKNYNFNRVVIVLAFCSLPFLHPTIVLQYLFLNLILIFIYYHTRAFQLTLFFMVIALIFDHVFALLYSPQELRYGNIIKDHIIGNEIAYYLFMALVLVLFLYILFSFKSPEKRKLWLNKSL
jgi:hypothetical protein